MASQTNSTNISTAPSPSSGKSFNFYLTIGIVSVSGALIACSLVIFIFLFLYVRRKKMQKRKTQTLDPHASLPRPVIPIGPPPVVEETTPYSPVPANTNKTFRTSTAETIVVTDSYSSAPTSSSRTYTNSYSFSSASPSPRTGSYSSVAGSFPKGINPSPANSFLIRKGTMTEKKKQEWAINYTDLKFGEQLGSGAYGVVYFGNWNCTEVAIKKINTRYSVQKLDLQEEAFIMTSLRPHPNLVMFMGVTLPPQPFCIVTEYCPNGSLAAYLKENPDVDGDTLLSFIRGIAAGMLHLHSVCKVVHRDLAVRNVLLSATFEPKICDFGMSRILSAYDHEEATFGITESFIGPLRHMAPEAINDRMYSIYSDVWSFGICMIEIVTRDTVCPELTPLQMATKVSSGELVPSFPPEYSEYWADLLELLYQCTSFYPDERPTFIEITKTLASIYN